MRRPPHQREKAADTLAGELAAIPSLSRAALVAQWTQSYGCRPPKGTSRRLLQYAAAYRAQSQTLGGLKPFLRRKLRQQGFFEQRSASPTARGNASKILPPGSRLVREWHGAIHTVDVLADGILYNGRRYRSLSEVAREITGTRWSGPRFFGL